MDANNYSASQSIYMNCIKYTRLNELVKATFPHFKLPKEINIFIDLNKVLSRFYSNPIYKLSKDISLAADIVNLAGHYSYYFKSTIDLPVKTHLCYGSYSPDFNLKAYPVYNQNRINNIIGDDYTKRVIQDNLDLVETISKYIPNLYYNTTKYEVGVLMYDIINRFCKDSMNIIITSDQYNYQLVSDNTIIFKPHKDKGEDSINDRSYVIYKNNVIDVYCFERKLKVDRNYQVKLGLNGELLSLFYALNGLPCRNVNTKGRAKASLKYINGLIRDNLIINGHNTLSESFTEFDTIEDLYERYKAIDIQTAYSNYKNSIDFDKVSFNTLYDPKTVNMINNNYFKDNPILIDSFGN